MPSRLQVVFVLDIALLVSVCALETVPITGLIAHEWLGLAVAGMVVAHLLLSWAWIASTTGRLMRGVSRRTRVNYFLNAAFFFFMTAVIFSGVLISQQALPAMTGRPVVELAATFPWDRIHGQASNFIVVLASLHLAMNWEWLAAAWRKVRKAL